MRIALRRLVVAGSDSLKTIEASLIRASFNVIKLSVTTIDNSIFQDPGFQYKLFSSSLPSPVSPLSTVYLACEQAFSLSRVWGVWKELIEIPARLLSPGR